MEIRVYFIVHRTGRIFGGRDGGCRAFPLFFSAHEEAAQHLQKMQVSEDWNIQTDVVQFEANDGGLTRVADQKVKILAEKLSVAVEALEWMQSRTIKQASKEKIDAALLECRLP